MAYRITVCTENYALAESVLHCLICPSASSRDGEPIVVASGMSRYRHKSAAFFAEHGWYRGYFRPMIFSWDVFIFSNILKGTINYERNIARDKKQSLISSQLG